MPKLSCPNTNDTSLQTGCKCDNVIVNGAFQRTCDCNVISQTKQYTVKSLTSAQDNCVCNGTTCGCCISKKVVETITERQCAVNEYRSICSACAAFSANNGTKSLLNCSACITQENAYTVFNQSYNNVANESCLCRDSGSNCTCCLPPKAAVAPAPVCVAPATELLSNCACTNFNGTLRCDCSKIGASNVEAYFNNITGTNCSCLTVQRPSNRQPLQCACCATPALIATPQPVCQATDETTVEQCACTNDFKCDCRYKSTGVTIRDMQLNSTTCGCPNNNATIKQCGCCVAFAQYKDAVVPSCQRDDIIGNCSCRNISTTVRKVVTTVQRCNCTGDLKTDKVNVVNNQDVITSPSQCNYYTEKGQNVSLCCIKEQSLLSIPARACRVADQLNATCTYASLPTNGSLSREGICEVRSAKTSYYFDALKLNNSECTCITVTRNGTVGQKCQCCAPKTTANATLTVKASSTCNLTTSTNQNCDCRIVFDVPSNSFVQSCDCTQKVGNTQRTRSNLKLDKSQCSCLNGTTDGNQNVASCICCVPNPPLTFCENLALKSSNNLNCRCNDVVINGKSVFSCDCNSTVNSTLTVTQKGMAISENSCCCTERSDPLTKKGFKQCNCTQAPIVIDQNCQCKTIPNVNKTSVVNCVCQDCNKVLTQKAISVASCNCPSVFFTSAAVAPVTNGTITNSTNVTVPAKSTKAENTTSTTNTTKTNTTNTTVASNTTSNVTNTSSASNVTGVSSNTTNATNTNGTKTNATTNSTGSNTTNSTNSTGVKTNVTTTPVVNDVFTCSCKVDFAGLCMKLDSNAPVDEGTCDASNRPQLPVTNVNAGCKFQYEYLVAVVATGKDANVLMQLQNYQTQAMMAASYFQLSLASIFFLATAFLFY